MKSARPVIALIAGDSQYDIFTDWQRELAQGLEEAGSTARILTRNMPDYIRLADSADATLGFNMVRTWKRDNFHQPHFAWVVDHPVHQALLFTPHFGNAPINPAGVAIGIVDRGWTGFAREIFQARRAEFLPHAATMVPATVPPWSERSTTPVFFGTLLDPEPLRAELLRTTRQHAPQLLEIMEKFCEEFSYTTGRRPDLMLWQCLEQAAARREQALLLMNMLFPLLDNFHRFRWRLRLLQELAQHTPIDFYGNIRGALPHLPEAIRQQGPRTHAQAVEIMRHSRLLINHTPTLSDGGHERIFDALAQGMAVLTTPSGYLAENPGHDAGILFCNTPADWTAALESARQPAMEALARRGRRLVAAQHTMRQRAETILAMLDRPMAAAGTS